MDTFTQTKSLEDLDASSDLSLIPSASQLLAELNIIWKMNVPHEVLNSDMEFQVLLKTFFLDTLGFRNRGYIWNIDQERPRLGREGNDRWGIWSAPEKYSIR